MAATTKDFLSALCGASESGIVTFDGPEGPIEVPTEQAVEFLTTNPDHRLHPVCEKQLLFFVGLLESPDPDAYQGCALRPTVVEFDETRSILCYALETPLPVGNAEVIRLMEFFGMVVDEAIPVPNEKWKLLRADPETSYTVEQLSTAYLGDTIAPTMYGDAKTITPYREADNADETWITDGDKANCQHWKPQKGTRANVVSFLCERAI